MLYTTFKFLKYYSNSSFQFKFTTFVTFFFSIKYLIIEKSSAIEFFRLFTEIKKEKKESEIIHILNIELLNNFESEFYEINLHEEFSTAFVWLQR